MKALETLRHWFAAIDSVRCQRQPGRARYQGALLTAQGEILPVASATFRQLANAEWWVHEYGPTVMAKQQAALGSRWIVVDLP